MGDDGDGDVYLSVDLISSEEGCARALLTWSGVWTAYHVFAAFVMRNVFVSVVISRLCGEV